MKNAKLHWKLKRSVSAPKCQYSPAGQSLIPSALPGAIRAQFRPKKLNQKAIPAHARAHFSPGTKSALQSRTKLLEKVFPIMSTFLRNKTISKPTPLRKENPFPQFNVASHKRPGIRLSFEYTTTLLSGEGGEGKTGTATMFRKMLSKYTIFSTVLSKIVANWTVLALI